MTDLYTPSPAVPVLPRALAAALWDTSAWETLSREIVELQRLAETPQDPRHHAEGNVAVHTQMVIEALRGLPSYAALSPIEQQVLLLAAVFHDIGKATTTVTEDDGRITSRGHAQAGALLTRRILWEIGVPFALREQVVGLVRWHMRPPFLAGEAVPERELARVSLTARCDHLAILAEADSLGRIAPNTADAIDAVHYFRDFAAEAGCLSTPWDFPSDHARVEAFRHRDRDFGYSAFDDTWGEALVMAGLPGSGKDTWIATNAGALPMVSLDVIREANRRMPPSEVAAHAYEEAKVFLRAKRPFVWNSTNLVRDLRGGLFATLYRYGARARVVYLEVPPDQRDAQNRGRAWRSVVPDGAMDRFLSRWDIPDRTEAHVVEHHVTD